MGSGHPVFRRRRLLVDTRIQLRFVWFLFLQMVIIIFLIGYFSYSHITETQRIALSGKNLSMDTIVKLHSHFAMFMNWMLALSMVVTILLIFFGILASHKIAGPVLKLKGFLNAVAAGDLSRHIAFRRKDQLDDFALVLNETVSSLANRETKRDQVIQDLSTRVDALTGAFSAKATRGELERLVGEIKPLMTEFRDVL